VLAFVCHMAIQASLICVGGHACSRLLQEQPPPCRQTSTSLQLFSWLCCAVCARALCSPSCSMASTLDVGSNLMLFPLWLCTLVFAKLFAVAFLWHTYTLYDPSATTRLRQWWGRCVTLSNSNAHLPDLPITSVSQHTSPAHAANLHTTGTAATLDLRAACEDSWTDSDCLNARTSSIGAGSCQGGVTDDMAARLPGDLLLGQTVLQWRDLQAAHHTASGLRVVLQSVTGSCVAGELQVRDYGAPAIGQVARHH